MDKFETDDARLWRLLKEVRETVPGASPMPLQELFRIAKIAGYVRVDNYGRYNREKVQNTIAVAKRWADWEEHRRDQILQHHTDSSPYEDLWELCGPDPADAQPCACMRQAQKLGRYARAKETFRTPLPECERIWKNCWTSWAFAFVRRKRAEKPSSQVPMPGHKKSQSPAELETLFRRNLGLDKWSVPDNMVDVGDGVRVSKDALERFPWLKKG